MRKTVQEPMGKIVPTLVILIAAMKCLQREKEWLRMKFVLLLWIMYWWIQVQLRFF
jgi:hypothetical protein